MMRVLIVASGLLLGSGLTLEQSSTSRTFLAAEESEHAEVHQHLEDLAQELMSSEKPAEGAATLHARLKTIAGKMDTGKALKAVAKMNKVPAQVRALVMRRSETSTDPIEFNDASMEKARVALNDLVEKAWVELDDKIIACKEYQQMNRATFDQVVTDIARLVEQITDLERIETESMEGIAKTEAEIKDVETERSKATREYEAIKAKNTLELRRRQNDLDVFQFILEFTKCGDTDQFATFLQSGAKQHSLEEARICSIKSTGEHAMCFSDENVQRRYNHAMSKDSRQTVSKLLAEVQPQNSFSFLQMDEDDDPEETETTTQNPSIAQAQAAETVPVAGGDEPLPKGFVPAPFCCEAYGVSCGAPGGGIMCSPDPPDCGLLHDKLSLMWGNYKDQVDELNMEMSKNEFLFMELMDNFNHQIKVLVNSKARFAMLLAEARSNLAADREEVRSKEEQKTELEKQYRSFMKKCCERVKWIMFQDMCALIVVRNAVMENPGATTCPGANIVDCEVDYWVGKECDVKCDDSCPAIPDPTEVYECGGWQELYRKVVVAPDASCGLRCPELTRTSKCNQKKCEVDCVMSEWSGWSKCTAECEGGVRSKTRSIMTHTMNGGLSCNTNEETEACNTMSCDRDCQLSGWTDWSPCSVACGGGFQTSQTHVIIPTRGMGKCPKEQGPQRLKERECNTQDCQNDEICIAKQDLVIAIDGSGSVRDNGFSKIRSFALACLERYRSRYFDSAAMKVGVVEFGNGVILSDGVTVSPAISVSTLSDDLDAVKTALEGTTQQKGFTNMAQAFALAETMYLKGGRADAQSAIMVVTDGKPSFLFQTREMVEQLDDKGVQRYFVVVSEKKEDVDLMKKWASVPWDTNLIHIEGMASIEDDEGQKAFVERALTMFCPQAYSPSLAEVKEHAGGYMLVKEGGYCGSVGALLTRLRSTDAEQCSYLAQGVGATSFILGTWFRRGYCFAGGMEVSSTQFDTWTQNRVNPECAEGSGWRPSMIYDFYALAPVA